MYKISGVEKESDLNTFFVRENCIGYQRHKGTGKTIAETLRQAGAKMDPTGSIMTSNSEPMIGSISDSSNIQKAGHAKGDLLVNKGVK